MDRPGDRPGIQGKLLANRMAVGLNSFCFPLLTFLGGCTLSPMSVVFPAGVFTRLRVLTRHPRIWGFHCHFLVSRLFSAALPYEGKCQKYGLSSSLGLLLHVYIESGPPAMVKKIKQRSSYTPYHSNILTDEMKRSGPN